MNLARMLVLKECTDTPLRPRQTRRTARSHRQSVARRRLCQLGGAAGRSGMNLAPLLGLKEWIDACRGRLPLTGKASLEDAFVGSVGPQGEAA